MCIRRSVDGGYILFRENQAKRMEFNKNMKFVGDNKWLPKNIGRPLSFFKNLFKDSPCYVVGKGPSLDKIRSTDFKSDVPIFCLNHSINVIEAIFNYCRPNLFCVQQDASVGEECIPKTGTHLLSVNAQGWNPTATLYDSADFGEHTSIISVVAAVKLAKYMGCNHFTLLAFDAMKNKNTDYAKCIGRKPVKPQQFLKHKELVVKALGDSPYAIL